MFLGHYGVAFGAKRAAPRVGLGVLVTSVVGPPPPNTASLATVGLAGWLFVPWGYWIDRHRRPA